MKKIEWKYFSSKKFIDPNFFDPEIILMDTDTFEEYPIVTRDKQVKNWKKNLSSNSIFQTWLGFSVFALNYANCIKLENGLTDFFLCITITGFNRDALDIPKPRIFVTNSIDTKNVLREKFFSKEKSSKSNAKSLEMSVVKNGFLKINSLESFVFRESRFFDVASQLEIVRVYCIPLVDAVRLENLG